MARQVDGNVWEPWRFVPGHRLKDLASTCRGRADVVGRANEDKLYSMCVVNKSINIHVYILYIYITV